MFWQEKREHKSINPNKKTLSKKERATYILESFEGIGPKTAEILLNELGSLRNIFYASKDILEEKIEKNSKDLIFLMKSLNEKNSNNR
jgi:ERCC4-type nuclease